MKPKPKPKSAKRDLHADTMKAAEAAVKSYEAGHHHGMKRKGKH